MPGWQWRSRRLACMCLRCVGACLGNCTLLLCFCARYALPTWQLHPPTACTPHPACLQVGDDVVYLREGHEQFLAATNAKRPPPWRTLSQGRSMRPAEPARWVLV